MDLDDQNIDYIIVNRQRYFPIEGKIDSIRNKDSGGFKVYLDDRIKDF